MEPDLMRDYCREYLDGGIALIPLYRNAHGQVIPAVRGAILNESKDGYNDGVALRTYNEFATYLMAHPQITMMGFYPKFANLFVLDLDNSPAHANQANGIANFVELVNRSKLANGWRTMFRDFPHNFPCYVVTPHGGIHLYFKADFIPTNWQKDTATNKQNIEIKYNNQVTAAGSIRDGITYVMQGCLENAPAITLDLLDVFTKPLPKPVRAATASTWNKPLQEQTAKWNTTVDGIIEKAREKCNGTAHEFVSKCGQYFSRAGFSFDVALAAVESTPEHINRTDKQDTRTCLKSFYK